MELPPEVAPALIVGCACAVIVVLAAGLAILDGIVKSMQDRARRQAAAQAEIERPSWQASRTNHLGEN